MIPLLALDWPTDANVARPCRPTISCMAELAAPGTFEVESGATVVRNDRGMRQWSFPFLLKQTFAKFLQVQVGSNGVTLSNANPAARYFDNVFVGPKFHLLDQGKILPAVCLTALASFPTADAPGYTRHGNAFFTAHASKDFGPIHIDANAGVNLWGIEGSPLAQSFVALAASPSLPPPFGVAAELYGFSDAAPIAPRDGGVRLVVTATPRRWIVFDMGGDIGWFPSTRVFSAFFGMTVIPVVFWR